MEEILHLFIQPFSLAQALSAGWNLHPGIKFHHRIPPFRFHVPRQPFNWTPSEVRIYLTRKPT